MGAHLHGCGGVVFLCVVGTLTGILSGEFPSVGLVARSVGFVDVGNLGNQRIVGVGVGQHGADGEQHL